MGSVSRCISIDEVTDPNPETFQLSRFERCTLLLLRPSFHILLLPSVLGKAAQTVFAVGYVLSAYVYTHFQPNHWQCYK